jgi:lipopolysaccharide export system permease protein
MLKQYEHVHNDIFPGSTQGLVTNGGQIWLKQQEEDRDILIYAQNVTEQGHKLEKATLFVFNKDGVFQTRVDAEKMFLTDEKWILSNIVKIKPGVPSEKYDRYILPTTLKPEMIQNSFTSPNTLSVWEMGKFIKLLKDTGFPSQKHELYWHKLMASPALILAMFLLAAPFALHFSRNRSTGSILLLGLVFGFLFYFFTNLVSTQGLSGAINLAVAAWIPTAIAGFLGLSFFLHFREE